MLRTLSATLAAYLVLAACPAGAQTFDDVLSLRDPAQITTAAADAPRPQRALAESVVAALYRDDARAIRGLTAATRNRALTAAQRVDAWQTLAGIYLRQNRFGEAVEAMRAADAMGVARDPEIVAAFAQARTFAEALVNETPMGARVAATGDIPLTRDAAQLLRANVAINGAAQDAVLDSGAAFSTMTQSTAERLGLRFIDAEVTVGTASVQELPSRLAVAERLTLAGGEFTNVVFIVVPDEALSFANGAYKIEAIVGLPVMLHLRRLEFIREAEGERLRHRASPYARNAQSNLYLDGLQPMAIAQSGGARLRMLLDTGARRTTLSRVAARDFPALVAEAETRATTTAGGGGESVDHDALAIPRITLAILDHPTELQDIRVVQNAASSFNRHGAIGQDLLRSAGGYVLDFDAMRLELLPRAE